MGCGSSNAVEASSKMQTFRAIVTSAELKGLYDAGTGKLRSNYRLLESAMSPDVKGEFDKGHIPDAMFFDLTKGVESSKLYPKAVPDKSKFSEYVGSLGISNNHHVIVYDRSPFGFLAAPRLWWLLKLFGHANVSVLNGGLTKWNAEQGQLSTETPAVKTEAFTVHYNAHMVRSYDDIVSNLTTKNAQIVDARPNEDFTGTAPTKVPEGKLGHIPLAKNIPHMDMVNKTTGLLKTKDEILQIFASKNVGLKQKLILHCLSSVTACTVLLAAAESGHENIPLYTGSWFEWSQRATDENCVKEP